MDIKSNVDGELIAVFHSTSRPRWKGSRVGLTEADKLLQVADIQVRTEGQVFPAHEHHVLERHEVGPTAEMWVVVVGEVEVKVYDIDRAELGTWTLEAGDLFLAFRGGHAYRIPRMARVLEVKTGPYLGKGSDKVVFEDNPWNE